MSYHAKTVAVYAGFVLEAIVLELAKRACRTQWETDRLKAAKEELKRREKPC